MSTTLALLDGLGMSEVLVIGVVSLLMFGSKRMPELARALGRAIREFKRATSGVEENIREVLYEQPPAPRLKPPPQRRPHRASTTESVAPAPATEPNPANPPAAPAPTGPDLNEPAPPEMPDFAAEAAEADPSLASERETPPKS